MRKPIAASGDPGTMVSHRPGGVVWLFAGDSITAGVAHTRGSRDYTQLFHERLLELGRSTDVVLNTAASGMWVRDQLAQIDERILRWHPDVVFLMFGTNDATGGLDELASYVANYKRLIEICRHAGIDVHVQTTVPVMPLDPDRFAVLDTHRHPDQRQVRNLRARLEFLDDYVQATRKVAADTRVSTVDHFAVWQNTGEYLGQLMDGELHPNEYGHRLLARTLFEKLGIWDEQSWTCRICSFVPTRRLAPTGGEPGK